jgi:threonylcarbamoyladenosine tRNA methylthiotransferase MtaB
MRIRLESIGCRLNISEIEAIARDLTTAGHTIVGPDQPADLCVVNTCTVTAVADRKSRQLLRQLRAAHPGSPVVATGCFSELAPDQVREIGVDLVVSNADKDRIPAVLDSAGILTPPDSGSTVPMNDTGEKGDRTRAFLKVQDGCDNACTFCVVTVARGAGRSRPADDVVSEVRRLHGLGYLEVVLSGVHLGSYGHDTARPHGLEMLVCRILDETDVPRIRLSSLEPWDLDRSFFALFADRRLLPHLHIPLQSGCDATLARMARRTDRRLFSELLDDARSMISDVSISTDVMVGFPGETDTEFAESFDFVEKAAFSRLHIFRFSARGGTRAASMPDPVPGDVAQERSRAFHTLAARLETTFNTRFEGDVRPVLWEQSEPYGRGLRWSGLTDNFIRTITETHDTVDLQNRITQTKILETRPGGVVGEVEGISVAGVIEPESARALPVVNPR